MLAIHLLNHEGSPEAEEESRVDHLQRHLRWTAHFATNVVRRAERWGIVARQENHLALTDWGRPLAQATIVS